MSDLISRQAAIDAMYELMEHWFGSDSEDEKREIKRELDKLPSAQPEQRWIPVTERLPQEQRYTCELDGDRWNPDSFCSFAERRDNA